MHRALALLLGALILIADTPALPGGVTGGKSLVVIVHPARKAQLNLNDVVRIYLKRRRFWDDGQPIVALNQAPGSPARETFSQLALGSESTRLSTIGMNSTSTGFYHLSRSLRQHRSNAT
ncbi:MAG: hypothetical protein ACHQ9S_11215 [Candidatus Binatia bacterium]